MEWASKKHSTNAAGEDLSTPTGDACEPCYSSWKQHHSFRKDCSTFASFCRLNDSDRSFKQAVDQSILAANTTENKGFAPESMQTMVNHEIVVRKHFVVLNEIEVCKVLGVPKLSKQVRDKLSAFKMPAQGDSSTEVLYSFADPDKPYRTAEVCVGRLVCGSAHRLESSKSSWEGEAEAMASKHAAEMHSQTGASQVFQKLGNRALYTVEAFAAANGKYAKASQAAKTAGGTASNRDRAGAGGSSNEDGADGSDASSSDGEGSSDAGSPTTKARSNGPRPSPDKRLPPVPSFDDMSFKVTPKKARFESLGAGGACSVITGQSSDTGGNDDEGSEQFDGDADECDFVDETGCLSLGCRHT